MYLVFFCDLWTFGTFGEEVEKGTIETITNDSSLHIHSDVENLKIVAVS